VPRWPWPRPTWAWPGGRVVDPSPGQATLPGPDQALIRVCLCAGQRAKMSCWPPGPPAGWVFQSLPEHLFRQGKTGLAATALASQAHAREASPPGCPRGGRPPAEGLRQTGQCLAGLPPARASGCDATAMRLRRQGCGAQPVFPADRWLWQRPGNPAPRAGLAASTDIFDRLGRSINDT